MPLYYLSTIDKYLGKNGIFTHDEVSYADALEQSRRHEHKPTFYELIKDFPEITPQLRRILKNKIKQYNQDLLEADEIKVWFQNKIISKAKYNNRWFLEMVRDTIYLEPLTSGKQRAIKRCAFYLSALNPETVQLKDSKITEADISLAKQVPIDTLYTGKLTNVYNRSVGLCPFHNEKTPSFSIYKDTNRWYCYGCSQGGDVVDFVMLSDNTDFLSAVKKLLNK